MDRQRAEIEGMRASVTSIRLEGVRLTLQSRAGPVEVLKGVSLEVERGTSVGVVGPSGSGKSSLLMLIAGLERPTAGTIEVAGARLDGWSEDELAGFRGRTTGIVFQSFHLVPTMTALENVALPLELQGHGDPFGVAAEALRAVGLDHRGDHFPAELSGGEQQRVAIARAIAPEPAILLADEPTGNLDARTGGEIVRLLFDLQKRHAMTLVLVTHDLQLARRTERRITLGDGQIVADERIGAWT
jgi:putative ABC transport system ATP-binding protein